MSRHASPEPGPHFFCIGPANCATTWVADHLKFHRDIWLPPIQEISYLSAGFEEFRGSPELEYRHDWWSVVKRIIRNKSLSGRRDREFYEAARELASKPDSVLDLDGYRRLFEPAHGRLTGDISPSYATMPVEQIRASLPVLRGRRIFMIARNPVERFWSGMSMYYRARGYGDVDYGSVETAKMLFFDPVRGPHHFPTKILDRWNEALGGDEVKVVFFDDIAGRPEQALREIVDFIGADYRKRLPLVSPARNRKSGTERAPVSPEAREWVRAAFQEELEECARRFGEYGRRWRDRNSRPAAQ